MSIDIRKNRKKIMFVTMRNPHSGMKGEKVVVNNRCAYLQERLGQSVTFFVLHFFFQRKEEGVRYVKIGFWDLALGLSNYLIKGIPLQAALYSSGLVAKKVSKIFHAEKFDSIHFFQIRTFLVSREIETDRVVLEFIDALSLNYASRLNEGSRIKRLIMRHELNRLKRFEKSFDQRVKKIFVSSVDKDHLSLPSSIVAPNAVDVKFNLKHSSKEYDLVFSGNFNYGPNIESIKYFLNCIFPKLQKAIPEISLCLVGLGSEKFSNEDHGVYGLGMVDDIYKYIAKARISVAPMISGSGMQNKILEAFAVGLPVISTQIAYDPIVNFAGESECFICANTTGEWVQEVSKMLNSYNVEHSAKEVFSYAGMFSLDRCHDRFSEAEYH